MNKLFRVNVIDIVIYTVAVYAATVAIQIYQPATGGYFNLGESMIYLAALLSTPIVAGFAGGVGAALADLATGYAIFAPGTLVIKFIEGYLAGILVSRFRKTHSILSFAVGVLYMGLIIFFASILWAGEVYYGPSEFLGMKFESPLITIPLYIWIIVALFVSGLVTYVTFRKFIQSSEAVLLLLAGLTMVLGYFLYEYFVSNPLLNRPPEAAVMEIPVNIGQAVIGASIAIPVAGWLRKAGYGK